MFPQLCRWAAPSGRARRNGMLGGGMLSVAAGTATALGLDGEKVLGLPRLILGDVDGSE